jgi:hypothetical protein
VALSGSSRSDGFVLALGDGVDIQYRLAGAPLHQQYGSFKLTTGGKLWWWCWCWWWWWQTAGRRGFALAVPDAIDLVGFSWLWAIRDLLPCMHLKGL